MAQNGTPGTSSGLIKRNLNQPTPNSTMNGGMPIYNPYYDSGMGSTTSPNPYLRNRFK
jgi:hypothetical protein